MGMGNCCGGWPAVLGEIVVFGEEVVGPFGGFAEEEG